MFKNTKADYERVITALFKKLYGPKVARSNVEILDHYLSDPHICAVCAIGGVKYLLEGHIDQSNGPAKGTVDLGRSTLVRVDDTLNSPDKAFSVDSYDTAPSTIES